jgi:myo-inositol-1(or 4)-monophosphatase
MREIEARVSEPLEALARLALGVAEEAAALVLRGHRSRPAADHKGQANLVTEFDRASEALIVARLRAARPDVAIVAEEGSGDAGAADEALAFYVDPLDGTTNFVHGHPFWGVSIGLGRGLAPLAGAVVAPALALSWVGWRGGGVTRNGEPCRPSGTRALADALVATGFPPVRDRAPENNFDAFMRVKRRAQAVRRCGAAAIDLCMVADGTFDGYWERRLGPWDTMAGAALVLAGGGSVTALDGGPPDYRIGHVCASNGFIHAELCAAIDASARGP